MFLYYYIDLEPKYVLESYPSFSNAPKRLEDCHISISLKHLAYNDHYLSNYQKIENTPYLADEGYL